MKKLILLAVAGLMLVSCRFNVEPYNGTTQLPDAAKEARDSVRMAIVVKGDTTHVAELADYYKRRGRELDMLPFYVVLADKYGNEAARGKIVEICGRLSKRYPKLVTLGEKYKTGGQVQAKQLKSEENVIKANDEK